jgi:hypothetical protein
MLRLIGSKAGLNTYQISNDAHDFAHLVESVFKTHGKQAFTRYDGDDGEWYLFIDAPNPDVQLVITTVLFTAKSEWLKADLV